MIEWREELEKVVVVLGWVAEGGNGSGDSVGVGGALGCVGGS